VAANALKTSCKARHWTAAAPYAELDRKFVRDIGAAAGLLPEW